MKKILILLAPGFEEVEALAVADVLRRLGQEVILAGVEALEVEGSHHIRVTADLRLGDGQEPLCDALVLPGGMPGAVNLRDSDAVLTSVLRHYSSNRIVAAICAAPIVLAQAGILGGRRFTMYPGFEKYLNGAVPCTEPAVRDGNLVTGKGPGAVFAFAAEITAALGLERETAELYRGMFIAENR